MSPWYEDIDDDDDLVIPEEMRGPIPPDYGRSNGLAYYALMGFGRHRAPWWRARFRYPWMSAIAWALVLTESAVILWLLWLLAG